jgi:hypothetical protein
LDRLALPLENWATAVKLTRNGLSAGVLCGRVSKEATALIGHSPRLTA